MKKCIPLNNQVLVIEYLARPIAQQETVDRAPSDHMFMCSPKNIKAVLYTYNGAFELSHGDLKKMANGISEVVDKDFSLPAEDLRSY